MSRDGNPCTKRNSREFNADNEYFVTLHSARGWSVVAIMGFSDTLRAEGQAVESICRILREQNC